VVGESGCGKSTLVRAVLGILPLAARVEQGRILFGGEDLLGLAQRELTRRIRGKEISFIPQDPFLALNPVFTVGTQLLEIMRWHAPSPSPESSMGKDFETTSRSWLRCAYARARLHLASSAGSTRNLRCRSGFVR
jgi:ABC-type glutathione transport system ATPase component